MVAYLKMTSVVLAVLFGVATNCSGNEKLALWRSEFGGNDHAYLRVFDPNLNWDQANIAAQSRVFNGENGHLVSITSAAENAFLGSALYDGAYPGRYAIGALDDPLRWITGEPAVYQNYAPGEPNSGLEDILQIYLGFPYPGQWNDLNRNEPLGGGYIVEFNIIPEPCCAFLVVAGSAVLAISRQMR
jgi:hypothetical protein